uniref:glucuronosyltransferase n=1 Tax=Panagrellus redivivus TaxID=6233 RepID=A0A7E5A1T3_PANRE
MSGLPLLTVLTVFCLIGSLQSAKVLVFNPYFAHSHFTFQNALAKELVQAGHDVTILVPEVDPTTIRTPANTTLLIRKETVAPFRFADDESATSVYWKSEGFEFWNNRPMMKAWNEASTAACRRLLQDTEFIEKVKAEKFDIAVMEPLDMCGFGLLKLIGLKNYVLTIPLALADYAANTLGLPGRKEVKFAVNTDFYPDMGLIERIQNFGTPHLNNLIHDMEISVSAVRELADPDFNYDDIYPNARYIFLNAEEHVDFPRPISHKTIYIGGITINKAAAKPLPPVLAPAFDAASTGVVLVSFGSLAKSSAMPPEIKSAFIEMFEAFPQLTFVWKYENISTYPAEHLPNVVPSPWIPQKDILNHPKTLAFITHGGMNSITECAHAGVAAVAVPLFGDQPRNAKMLEYRKTAVIVDKQDITAENLIKAMKAAISPEFQKRADDLAAVIAAKPMQPKERFVKYFDHAVAFGDVEDFLDIKMRHMNVIRYYDLDIYLSFSAIVVGVLYLLTLTVKNVLSLVPITKSKTA